jgi:hypothetical protein
MVIPVSGLANFDPAIAAPAAISSLSKAKAFKRLLNSPLRAVAVKT